MPFVFATSSRISNTEITGSNRMNRNSRQKNRPIDPTYVPQSNSVGQPVYENAEVDIDEVMYDDEANAISAVRFHDERPDLRPR